MAEIEAHTQQFIASQANPSKTVTPAPVRVITIPVVVHVVLNRTIQAQNQFWLQASARIQAQIDILNKDFRALNSDIGQVPAPFASRIGDMRIQFCLAKRAPDGSSTSGIDTINTAATGFPYQNDNIKNTAAGGANAWPYKQYLNIWVGSVIPGPSGWADYPGGNPATDGAVVDYDTFGGAGSIPPFNLGRNATHEVGHWLNLLHPWGDGNSCGDDFVADTPVQLEANTLTCPAFPHVSTCAGVSNGPNGDIFMNYMDYTTDACKIMFTAGQVQRAQALFAPGGYRESLLSSPALVPMIAIVSANPAAPAAVTCGDLTPYRFYLNYTYGGCGGGSLGNFQWSATNGWAINAPNGINPYITPSGTTGSVITLACSYYSPDGAIIPLNPASVSVGFSGSTGPAAPVFLPLQTVMCANSGQTISVGPVAGASGYQWTVPIDFSGNGTRFTTLSPTTDITTPDIGLTQAYTLTCQALFPGGGCPSLPVETPLVVLNKPVGSIVDVDPRQRDGNGMVCRERRLRLRLDSPDLTDAGTTVTWAIEPPGSAHIATTTTAPAGVEVVTDAGSGMPFSVVATVTNGCGGMEHIVYEATTLHARLTDLANGYVCANAPTRPVAPSQAYPNPVASVLSVTDLRGMVLLYDSHGQPVRQVMVPDAVTVVQIPVAGLPAGLYYLRGRNAAGEPTRHRIQIEH